MNNAMIRYILGTIVKIEGALLLLPCLIALVYQEKEGFVYLIIALLALALGYLLSKNKPKNTIIYLKEGCVSTALSWITLSFLGGLPFIFTGEIPHFTDAIFESVSGFTTTGATILSDIELLSHCSLFWRCFTNWIGGMGVLVFLLAVIPMSGGSNINLMRAESPGPSVGKLVPKLVHTARILYFIYFGLTILQIIFLLMGDMPFFDAICTAAGTAGTGGFGIKNDSLAGYSSYIQWVVLIFMLLFGINFNAYYYIMFRQMKAAFTLEEVRTYLLIIIIAAAIVVVDIIDMAGGLLDAVTQALFQVTSIITTSAFATTDYDLWPQTSRIVLVLLMFCGACAGSTGGGIKMSRCIIAVKSVFRELNSYIHPKSVKKIKFEGKTVDQETIHSVNVYFITFILLFLLSLLIISFEGKDFTTSFTAVLATLNNIGPGLSMVGPTCNYGHFSILSKWMMMFNMLAGRLELFPILLLFHPVLWKETIKATMKKRKITG